MSHRSLLTSFPTSKKEKGQKEEREREREKKKKKAENTRISKVLPPLPP
jgi:hypothetical protein